MDERGPFEIISLFSWRELHGKYLKIVVNEGPDEKTTIVSALDETNQKVYVLELFQDGRHIGGAGVK